MQFRCFAFDCNPSQRKTKEVPAGILRMHGCTDARDLGGRTSDPILSQDAIIDETNDKESRSEEITTTQSNHNKRIISSENQALTPAEVCLKPKIFNACTIINMYLIDLSKG